MCLREVQEIGIYSIFGNVHRVHRVRQRQKEYIRCIRKVNILIRDLPDVIGIQHSIEIIISTVFLYSKYTGGLSDGRLGMQLSHGCVRLNINCAKWLYDYIPIGTTVLTY